MRRFLPFLCLVLFAGPVLAAGRLADVEIYDRATGRALPVYESGGPLVRCRPARQRIPGHHSQPRARRPAGGGFRRWRQCRHRRNRGAVAERLCDRARPTVVHRRLAQEPGESRRLLFHRSRRFLCGPHRAPGQRRRDRRGAVPAQGRAAGGAGATEGARRAAGAAGESAPRSAAAPQRRRKKSAPAMGAVRMLPRAMSNSSANRSAQLRSSPSTTTPTPIWLRAV